MQGEGRSKLRRSGSKWSHGGIVDQSSVIRITSKNSKIRIGRIVVKSRIRIRVKVGKRGIRPYRDPDPQHCGHFTFERVIEDRYLAALNVR
jgi:hypothetical protein